MSPWGHTVSNYFIYSLLASFFITDPHLCLAGITPSQGTSDLAEHWTMLRSQRRGGEQPFPACPASHFTAKVPWNRKTILLRGKQTQVFLRKTFYKIMSCNMFGLIITGNWRFAGVALCCRRRSSLLLQLVLLWCGLHLGALSHVSSLWSHVWLTSNWEKLFNVSKIFDDPSAFGSLVGNRVTGLETACFSSRLAALAIV